jgi:NADH-quinone oxidoreductase subunit B
MSKGREETGSGERRQVGTEIPRNWFIARLDDLVVNWARRGSMWPMPFGTACCAIEMMATGASKYDMARYGMERMGYTPRQADVMIVAGRVAYKMAPVMRRIWDQMPQPKWCISMGACASTGGVFDTYTLTQGIDTIVPVDVYVPGCPPRPEGLLYALLMIQEKIKGESIRDARPREEDPERVGKPHLTPDEIEHIAQPFGNSTFQNRVSGLESSSPILRPGDRKE